MANLMAHSRGAGSRHTEDLAEAGPSGRHHTVWINVVGADGMLSQPLGLAEGIHSA
jgi:hypothetical protein